jgi:hypothetical protein
MRWAGHIASMRRRAEGRRPLGRSKSRMYDTIEMDLREVGVL